MEEERCRLHILGDAADKEHGTIAQATTVSQEGIRSAPLLVLALPRTAFSIVSFLLSTPIPARSITRLLHLSVPAATSHEEYLIE